MGSSREERCHQKSCRQVRSIVGHRWTGFVLECNSSARSWFVFGATSFSQVIPCANSLISAPARPPRARPARDALTACDETRNPDAVSATAGRPSVGHWHRRHCDESCAMGSGRTIMAASPSGATAGNFRRGRQRRRFILCRPFSTTLLRRSRHRGVLFLGSRQATLKRDG